MNSIVAPNLASPQFKANPHPFYARLRAEAPVYATRLPTGQAAWLVTRYDDVAGLLKDGRFAKDRRNAQDAKGPTGNAWVPGALKALERNMLDQDAPDHTRLRALVHKAFTPRRIEQLRARIQTLCDELLDAVQAGGRIELIHDYALPLPITIIAEMLGVPLRDRGRFHAWSSRIVSIATPRDGLLALPMVWQMIKYLRTLIRQRRADPQDDLLTSLIQAEEAGDVLSEDELLAMIILLLVAGHETTVNLIGNGTLALLEHPAALDQLRQDAALMPAAVEELLRYTSPVEVATERYARAALALQGVAIPRGGLVLGVLGSANRDERQFAAPDTLDITRTPNRHLAFGQGAHYCLGAPLARLEGQIAFTTLLQHHTHLRLARPPEALRWHRGIFLRGLEQLPLAC
jgi:cytochrome P450 PksS